MKLFSKNLLIPLLAVTLLGSGAVTYFAPKKIQEESTDSLFDVRVPVISLKDFNDPERREHFIDKLGTAFEEHGFVAVSDTDIDSTILENAHKAIRDFFAQDSAVKRSLQNKQNSGERGYVTGETPKRQPIHVKDFKEILHIGRELTEEQKKRLSFPENIWPENSPLKESVMPLYNELERVMQPIAAAASEYLGEKPELFPEMMHEGEHLLRALHYLRNPGQKNHWAAEHTDMNFLTLIPGGASSGLQVQLKDGRWIDVLVPKNSVVVNVGDSLEQLSNGVYRSGVHRVVSKPNSPSERWSIVYHGHTRHTLDMSPLKSAIELSGGVQHYPNAKGWELLYAQIAAVGRASPSMLKELAQSGVMERKIAYNKASAKVMKILDQNGLASEQVQKELKRLEEVESRNEA